MQLRSHPTVPVDRLVLSAQAPSLAALTDDLSTPRNSFILFLAADTRDIPGAELVSAAGALLRAGAVYVCCWGPECSRLHDCFDEAELAVNSETTDDRLVLTTWHADESLEEALWFAVHATSPAPAYEASTRTIIAASIGDTGWGERIAAYLDAGTPLPDEI